MNFKIKVFFFLLIMVFSSSISRGSALVTEKLEYELNGKKHSISAQLSFPYFSFEKEHSSKHPLTLGYILQGTDTDTVLEKECKYFIIPYLEPCTGIVVLYDQKIVESEDKFVYIAHKDHSIQISSIVSNLIAMLQKVKNYNNKKLTVTLFSSFHDEYAKLKQERISYKLLYQSRTQENELKHVQANLMKGLKAKGFRVKEHNFKRIFAKASTEEMLLTTPYNGASNTLVVTREGRIFTTSIFKEELFPSKAINFKKLKSYRESTQGLAEFLKTFNALNMTIYKENFPNTPAIKTYDSLPIKPYVFQVYPYRS